MQSLRRFSLGLLQASKSSAPTRAAAPVAAFHTEKPSNANAAAAAEEVASGKIIAVIGAVVDVQVKKLVCDEKTFALPVDFFLDTSMHLYKSPSVFILLK